VFLVEFDLLPRILTLLFLMTAMLSVGLQTTAGDLRSLLKSKGLLLRSLLANFVAVPIVGIVLVRTLPFKPEAAAALLLLACTPGGISALQFTTRIKGASLFAGSSAFLLTFVAVFLSPALLTLVLPGDISVVIPYGRALLFVVVFLLLPLVGGTLVRSREELLAEKLSKPCAIISLVLFIVVLVLIMGLRKEAMNAVGKEALLYMLIFIIISMAVGWFMGGPAKDTPCRSECPHCHWSECVSRPGGAGTPSGVQRPDGATEHATYGLYVNPFQEGHAGITKMMIFNRNRHLDHEREAERRRYTG
jgi:predicted Na+-dependent transporter